MIEIRHLSGTVIYTATDATDIKAALVEAVKKRADMRDADLRDAYLRDAYLRDAYLRGADLRGADLRGADLRGADLRGADLRGAYLRGAYLRDDLKASGPVSTGYLLGYTWTCFSIEGGPPLLQYGCEQHRLPEWTPEKIRALCATHVMGADEREKYARVLVALVSMLDAAHPAEVAQAAGSET